MDALVLLIVLGAMACVVAAAALVVYIQTRDPAEPEQEEEEAGGGDSSGDSGGDSSGGELASYVGSGVDTATYSGSTGDLPPPSSADRQCVTSMIHPDPAECQALVYNHCTSGFKDQNKIPAHIMNAKRSIMQQMYNNSKENYDEVPKEWSTVCATRPDKAGKGNCGAFKKNEFRVWTRGRLDDKPECVPGGSLYIKAHFNANTSIQSNKLGKVGHG